MDTPVDLKAYKLTANRYTPLFVPDRFASIQATEDGVTDIWFSPVNNFMLLGFSISVAGTLADAAGELIIQMLDVEADFIIAQFSTFLNSTATGGGPAVQFGQDFGGGYGYLSATPSETLAVVLNQTMDTGRVCVNAWGVWGVTPDP